MGARITPVSRPRPGKRRACNAIAAVLPAMQPSTTAKAATSNDSSVECIHCVSDR